MVGQEEYSIEEAYATRKERLRALRAAQELSETPDVVDNNTTDDNETSEEAITRVKFRNYFPRDKKLIEEGLSEKGKLVRRALPKFDDPIGEVVSQSEKNNDTLKNLVLKKPHFELHRDVQKRLAKLERQTQIALCKLARQERMMNRENEDASMEQAREYEYGLD